MMYFEQAQHHCGGTELNRRFGRLEEGKGAHDPLGESIPCRYRDGRGGIDLERVRKDRLRARQHAVRAMLRRLTAFWRP
ncbi:MULTISPECIES: hypothetical protein [Marinobacter]|uniref:hypothetical protein n=2 Tax=Marinobacter TaxID=2742 RepID=UPI0011086DA4|nr:MULTISPECIES: hypothetical protein [Marinobacter]